MSAPPHDGWPAEGSRWEHWDDLLLACQLAGLRDGWTGISKRWDDRQPEKLLMRCHIEGKSGWSDSCDRPILTATPEDPKKLDGRWIVRELQSENFDSKRHPADAMTRGLSTPVKNPNAKRVKVKLDKVIEGWDKLHLIESSLEVEARRTHRYIQSYTRVTTIGAKDYMQCFGCVLGEKCSYLVRFRPVSSSDSTTTKPKWKCTDLCRTHSCVPYDVCPPSALLERSLNLWPAPKYSRSHHDTVRTLERERAERSTKTHDHLGPYRLLAAGETLETKFPPTDPILTAKLDPLKLSRSETRKSLSTIETTLRNLRSELALADIMGELDETKRLREALKSAGQEKEKYLAKLAEIEVEMKEIE